MSAGNGTVNGVKSQPLDTGLNGAAGNHDATGRFVLGNQAGRGNPHHRRMAALRA